MRVDEQPAYILHQRLFRDTSQILEIFSKDFGRLSIMSKGSRAPKSRLKGVLQPFRPLLLSWSGRGEMPTLSRAEPASNSVPFMQGKALACAMYVNELMMYLTYRHDVHSDLFSQYHTTIHRLSEHTQLEKELRLFELALLQQLGVAIDFVTDANSGLPINPSAQYVYQQEHGMVEHAGFKPKGVPVMAGQSLIALAEQQLDDAEVLRDAKHLMRYVLTHQLGGKTLKSRELFR